MELLLISLSILITSSVLIFLFCRSRKIPAFLFLWSLVAACGLAFGPP